MTRDNVSLKVRAVLSFRVVEPDQATVEIENSLFATCQRAQDDPTQPEFDGNTGRRLVAGHVPNQ
jgi:regulator of protease activity HflC (stomatin/prohibitin superfamily)